MIKRPLLAGALAAAAASPTAAQAAGDIFLNLLSAGIQGESTNDKHKNEIDILSFSLGFVNQPAAGGGSGGGAGKVSCGDIHLVKLIDKASPSLIGAVMTGKHLKSGVLTFSTAGAVPLNYYVLSLTDLLVTSITQSDSVGGTKVTEQISISAAKFKFEYKQQKADGSLGAAQTFTFDCAANKAG